MLKIKDMNLNNVIRQGDSQPREYQLDTGYLDLNLTNKSATIRLMTTDFQGIGYETTATVSSENKISFSIDDVIPARQYRLEVTVDDYVFPSRATDGKFSIDPSSHGQEVNIIQIIGKDEIVREVKEQVINELGATGGDGGGYDDIALQAHISNGDNPHNVTKSQVGLGNVDNTSDANKPVSTAMQSALNNKADKSQVLTNVPANAKFTDTTYTAGTGINITGEVISATGGGSGGYDDTSVVNHMNDRTNPHDVTKSQVGLGNVDDIKQASKVEFDNHNQDNTRHITASERNSWNSKQDALEFTAENTSNKGQAGGYAGLDDTGRVPFSQLPNFEGGDSSVEVEQARVDTSGHTNATLKERLDKEHTEVTTQLAQKASIEQMNRFELSVNVSSFGGVPDDETVDNLSAIQDAIDFVHSEGGGKVVFDGIYYTDASIHLKDNVYLDGRNRSGGVKLIPTALPFYGLFRIIDKVSNWGIVGLYIDSSFEERSVNYDISQPGQAEVMISLEDAHNGLVINNEIYGNGKWLFCSHAGETAVKTTDYSTNIRVENNYFEWFPGESTQRPNLPEGVLLDNTAVYFDAVDYTFKDNTVITEFSTQTMTALEVHCVLATVTNNRLIGFRKGVILVSLVLDSIKEIIVEDNYLLFEGNVIEKCLSGVTTEIFEGYNLDSVSVINNRIYPDPTAFGSYTGFHGVNMSVGDPSAPVKALQIEGNYVYFDSWLENLANSDEVVNYTGIKIGVGVHEGLSISSNTIINAPGTGITILNRPGGYVTVKSGVIQNNTIINAGMNTNIATEVYNPRTAIRVVDSARTTIQQLIIGENNIIDTRENGTYFTAPTYVDGNAYLKPQNILTTDGVINDTGGDTGEKNYYNFHDGYNYLLDNPNIDDYPLGVTVTNVSTAKSTELGFPENRSGTLTTYKFSEGEHGFNFQTYRVYASGEYFRRFDHITGEPLEWSRNGTYKLGHQNEMDASTPIADFPLGVSVNNVTESYTIGKGFPEEVGGTLTTYKYADIDHGYSWQEYKIYGETKTYVRAFSKSGTPTEWEQDDQGTEGLLNEATGTRLKYWAGSQAEYDAIGTYDLETVYDVW